MGSADAAPHRHGWTAVVDRNLCVGFAECVKAAPTVFQLDGETIAVVLEPESVDRATLRAAAEACPVDAISLYDAGGNPIPARDLRTGPGAVPPQNS
jgi:ferredoxin